MKEWSKIDLQKLTSQRQKEHGSGVVFENIAIDNKCPRNRGMKADQSHSHGVTLCHVFLEKTYNHLQQVQTAVEN